MSETIKKNVSEFNRDVTQNGGYQYTQNAPFSSVVSNKRLTDVTEGVIRSIPGVRTVLDAGCGDGTYTAELKARLPHIHFTGFDPASVAIAQACTRYPDCQFLTGDLLESASIPQGPFDLVVLRGVLHHLPTQHAAILNAASAGTRVLLIEPNGNNPILKWIEKNSAYHIQHEEQSFSSKFLCDLYLKSGLKVTRVFFVGFVPFFFPTVPAKLIYFFQPLLEKIPGLAYKFGGQVVILGEKTSG